MKYKVSIKTYLSNNEKDGIIKEKDLAIEGFKAETSKLQANLGMFQNQKDIYESKIEVNV